MGLRFDISSNHNVLLSSGTRTSWRAVMVASASSTSSPSLLTEREGVKDVRHGMCVCVHACVCLNSRAVQTSAPTRKQRAALLPKQRHLIQGVLVVAVRQGVQGVLPRRRLKLDLPLEIFLVRLGICRVCSYRDGRTCGSDAWSARDGDVQAYTRQMTHTGARCVW